VTPYIPLEITDLALAAALVALNAALSIRLALNIERQLLVAALRMVVQLSLLGFVLKALFSYVSPLFTGLAALAMILFAGREVVARQERRLTGAWAYGVGTAGILFAGTVVTVFALATQVQPDPWYHPRYALPLLGMILGNTMTGVALGLNTLFSLAARDRAAIEAQLSLGATRYAAMRPVLREAMRSGLMPIINSMSAAGLVFLPGMMTGQILAGVEPFDAIKYQILVMFLIAGGTGIGLVSALYGATERLTDSRHRLRLDRLTAR
jgi:putative ABC transport system permease protein